MKRAQIDITFNWMYILIAGAVILLFFVGLVVRQKMISEQELSADLIKTLGSIFVGASVAEKTKNVVDTSGLADYMLYFQCSDGVTSYGIEGSSAKDENSIDPLFSPATIQAPRLYTWSLPYNFPYKVTDFLLLSSSNTKYFVFGSAEFATEFVEAAEGFAVENVTDPADYKDLEAQGNHHIRIVDVDGFISDGLDVPPSFALLRDEQVSAVSFTGEQKWVTYYQKVAGTWEQRHVSALPIISLGGKRDAALYGAVFAADEQAYQCNMKKAFQRLRYVTKVYQGKVDHLISSYQNDPIGSRSACMGYLSTNPGNNFKDLLEQFDAKIAACLSRLSSSPLSLSSCQELAGLAAQLSVINTELRGCSKLY